jgi:hypothetical protein
LVGYFHILRSAHAVAHIDHAPFDPVFRIFLYLPVLDIRLFDIALVKCALVPCKISPFDSAAIGDVVLLRGRKGPTATGLLSYPIAGFTLSFGQRNRLPQASINTKDARSDRILPPINDTAFRFLFFYFSQQKGISVHNNFYIQ